MQITHLTIKKGHTSGYYVQKRVKKPIGNVWHDYSFGFFQEQYTWERVYVDEFLNESKTPIRFETREEAEKFIYNVSDMPKPSCDRIIKEEGHKIVGILIFISFHLVLFYIFWLLFF